MSNSSPQFVHLHVHTDFSKLDGLSSPESVVKLASQMDMPAVAITDHGNMGGIIKALATAQKIAKANEENGTNHRVPRIIPGLEAYQATDRFSKGRTEEGKQNYHLILLAVTDEGYRNLMRITSASNMRDSFYFNPRVDLELLRQHSEGIVCTTSCLGSSVNQALLAGNRELAKERAQELLDIFGPDRFFIEIQDHGIKEQLDILDDQVWLAKELGVGLLAAQDSHYDHQHDHETHEAMLAMQSGSTLDDPDRFKFHGDQHYFKSAEEMAELFPEDEYPGAVSNSLKIAEMASGLDIPYKKSGYYLLPHFPIPEDFDGGEAEYLTKLTMEGMVERYGGDTGVVPSELIEQAEYELGVIAEMGFPGYFLILGDGLRYLKRRGHVLPPGRGSAAGSIVAYAMNITNVPPNEHGLFFERFLNPGRRSMPDADIDLTDEARDDLIRYWMHMYGADRVSKIGTIGSFKARASIKSACRVMGIPATEANRLTKIYPPDISQVGITLNDLMKRTKSEVPEARRRQWSEGETFRDTVLNDRQLTAAIKIAMNVEGARTQVGIHAGGLLITPGPVSDYFPTRQDEETGFLVTQYDKDDVEDCGGVKIDLLGLMNLSVVQRTVQLIQDDLNIRINLDELPFDDPGVYRMLADGNADGIFQLSSDTMIRTLKSVVPTSFADISAVSALVRPGPMSMNTHMEYGDRKNGRSPIEVLHPEMMDILGETHGLVVYQEQVMALARHFAGYSLAEADDFRKAMGKKLPEAMAAEHDKFINGVEEKGYGKKLAQDLWDIIEPFSGYAFNKSHSVAYGFISYWTAYFKHHYPAQYAAACIEWMGDQAVAAQVASARAMGVQVYSPDINKSNLNATTSRDAIWLGMKGIRGSGDGVIAAILDERTSGPFKNMGDFLVRTRDCRKVNRRNVEGLIYVGAFDSLHPKRKPMIDNLENMLADAKNVASESFGSSENLLFDFGDSLGTVMDEYDLSSGDDYERSEKARMELHYLGFFAGKHPFAEIEPRIEDAKLTGKLPQDAVEPDPESLEEGDGNVYGILTELQHHKSKNGKLRSTFIIETSATKRLEGISFGYHLSDSLSGSFVNVSGAVRYVAQDDEQEWLQIAAKSVERIEIDVEDENAPDRRRRALRVVRGDRKREESPTISEVQAQAAESNRFRNRKARETEPEAEEDYDRPMALDGEPTSLPPIKDAKQEGPPSFRFYADGGNLSKLSALLTKLGRGPNQAIIHYGGADVVHDHLKFNIDEAAADEVAETLAIKWETA